MFDFLRHKYFIGELKDHVEIFLADLSSVRAQTKVLVIDDDEVQSGMPMVKYLKNHGFGQQNVQYMNVLERINDVEGFDLVLCDIQGVGESLQFENGLGLARELKNLYPTMGIIAFSANIKDYKECNLDGIFPKDAKANDRNKIIDGVLKKVFNPIECWKILRNSLLEHDVSIHRVAELENLYVRRLLNKRELTIDDMTSVIKDLCAVMALVNHLIRLSKMLG